MAVTSYGYIERDVFTIFKHGVFTLTQGDVASNIEAVAARGDRSSDPDIAQLQVLLERGEPQQHLVDAFELAKDAPCSTILVEEAHALGAVLVRQHADFSTKSLAVRQLLAQAKHIIEPAPAARAVERLESQIERAQRAVFNKINEYHMFHRSECRRILDETVPKEQRFVEAQNILKTREEGFDKLSLREQKAFRLEAIDFRAVKRNMMEEKVKVKRQKIEEIKTAVRDDFLERGIPNHVRSARLTVEEKRDVCRQLATKHVQSMQVDQERAFAASVPRPPGPQEREIFDDAVARLA